MKAAGGVKNVAEFQALERGEQAKVCRMADKSNKVKEDAFQAPVYHTPEWLAKHKPAESVSQAPANPTSPAEAPTPAVSRYPRTKKAAILFSAAFIFMLLMIPGVVSRTDISPWVLVAFAWIIPMAVHINKIREGNARNTILFGICALLFGGVISGFLLLLAPKDRK